MPSTTTDFDDRALVCAVVASIDDDRITLRLPQTDYQIRLGLGVPAREVGVEVGKRVRGTIAARALRVRAAVGGGRFIEPVNGEPRIIAGTVLAVDREGGRVLIETAVPMWLSTTENQDFDVFVEGGLVTCHVGVLYEGYEGAVGRSVRCTGDASSAAPSGQRDLERRLDRLRRALCAAVRPGATPDDICDVYDSFSAPRPQMAIVHGVGLGVEPPVAGPASPPAMEPLEPGMVVAVYAYVAENGVGGCFARDTLRLTEAGCDPLNAPDSAE